VAWATNYGMPEYMDSLMAYNIYQLLPKEDQAGKGISLLTGGLKRNPFNFLLVDAAQNAISTPQEQIQFWLGFEAMMAAVEKPGCPTKGLYNTTVKKGLFAKIGVLPVPEEKALAEEVHDFLIEQKCDNQTTLVKYRLALWGQDTVLARTEQEFKTHLATLKTRASRENDLEAAAMKDTIKAIADQIKDKKLRSQWATALWKEAEGNEKYVGHKYRVITNPSVTYVARLIRQKMPSEEEMLKPMLLQLESELKASVAGQRDIKSSRILAAKVKGVAGTFKKEPEKKKEWLKTLKPIFVGKETFKQPGSKKKAKPVQDPCVATIDKLLAV
jgi:hypothetical protein